MFFTYYKHGIRALGHWLRNVVWGCVALKTPFYASPAVRKSPILSKRVSSQDPLLRKFGNFSLYSLNFHSKFSSQVPKFGNFQLTSPQIWKFSVHKPSNLGISGHKPPPLFRGKYQFASPTLRKSGPHTPTWKKSWVPPRWLGYDFEPISLIRVWYFAEFKKILVLGYEKFVKILVLGGFLSRPKIPV